MLSRALFFSLILISFVTGDTRSRDGVNTSSEIQFLLSDFNGTDFNGTSKAGNGSDSGNATHADFDHEGHHHHDGEDGGALSSTVLRWVPGGISVGIFLVFTIAAAITTRKDHEERIEIKKEKEAQMPNIADGGFFEIDVISKLKKKDKNIFQRHLTQAKNRKFEVYNGMMRQYKDEIIARRAQEARHAELQREKEQREREMKEASLLKMGPLARRATRALGNASKGSFGSMPSSGSFSVEKKSSSANMLGVPGSDSDKNIQDTPSKIKPLRANNGVSYRHDIKEEDENDEGIVMKMKPKECKIDVKEETTFSKPKEEDLNENKRVLRDLPTVNLFKSTDLADSDEDKDDIPLTYLQPLNKSDSSVEEIAVKDMVLPKVQRTNYKIEGKLSKSFEQEALPIEDPARIEVMNGNYDHTALSPYSSDEAEPPIREEDEESTPWKKVKVIRPFTWSSSGNNADFGAENTDELVAKFRAISPDQEGKNEEDITPDEDKERSESATGYYIAPDEKKRDVIHLKKSKKARPFTWIPGEKHWYKDELDTDSIAEMVANFMDLGPSHSPEVDEEDEAFLTEMEQQMLENVNHEHDPDSNPLDDVTALEKILAQYSELVKSYSQESNTCQ